MNSSVGIPALEAAVVLAVASQTPGLLKGELVARAMQILNRDPEAEARVFLRYVDSLVGIGELTRHDHRFHVTPAGRQRLAASRSDLLPALTLLCYHVRP